MRTFKSLTILIATTQLAAIGCAKGRSYDPLHRLAVPKQNAPENSEAKTPAGTTTPPTSPKDDVVSTADLIADRKWCAIRKKDNVMFFVDRYEFSGTDTQTTKHEFLLFTPGQAPVVRQAKNFPRWTAVTDEGAKTPPELGVRALDAEAAQAHSDAGDQALLFRDLQEMAKVAVSRDPIGSDGAVRLMLRGRPAVTLFDCQNFSDAFVEMQFVAAEEPAAAKPTAPVAETPVKPVAPDEDVRATARSFEGQLSPLTVDKSKLEGTRWCSYKKIQNDTIVGLLRFGADNAVALDHFKASGLKMVSATKKDFKNAAITGGQVETSVTGVAENRIVTANGKSYRMIHDAKDKRAIVLDSLTGAQYPSSTGETFFECVPSNDPLDDADVTRNLTLFMNQAKR